MNVEHVSPVWPVQWPAALGMVSGLESHGLGPQCASAVYPASHRPLWHAASFGPLHCDALQWATEWHGTHEPPPKAFPLQGTLAHTITPLG